MAANCSRASSYFAAADTLRLRADGPANFDTWAVKIVEMKRLRRNLRTSLAAAAICATVVWFLCRIGYPGRETKRISDPAQMQAVLTRLVAASTPAQNARHILEHEGFKCSRLEDGDLYGDRLDGGIASLVKRRWQVIVNVRDDRTGEVEVTTGLVGP